VLNALKFAPSSISAKELIMHLKSATLDLAKKGEVNYIQFTYRYICEAKEASYRDEIWNGLHTHLNPTLGEHPMISIADSYRQEGIEQGMEKGMEKGIESVAKRLLQEKVEIAFIAKITRLSIDRIQTLQKNLNSEPIS
jgi:predicted transposase/invertase (TIGR01784 family)